MAELAMQTNVQQLGFEHYPNAGAARVLLLHGWGFDTRVWHDVLPQLQQSMDVVSVSLPGFGDNSHITCDYSDQQLLELLQPLLAPHTYILGWSLGGNLAVLLAKHYPQQVRGVICLASNPCFVEQPHWPGMAASTLAQFIDGFNQHAAKTIKQFVALNAMGDSQQRALLQVCRGLATDDVNVTMLHALNYLQRVDQRADVLALTMPVSYYLAECDVLVPTQLAGALQTAGIVVEQINNASHALPMFATKPWLDGLQSMLTSYGQPLDKRAIANAFGNAASTYDSAAALQVRVAEQTLSLLPSASFDTVVDLGCGTGYCLPTLAAKSKHLIAMDLSQGMLQSLDGQSANRVVGDAEQLPLADNSVDLVFSSLAVQWCQNLEQLFAEISRVLTPNGHFVFSTLGPESLGELRAAWWGVDRGVHVNGFASWQQLEQHFTPLSLQQHIQYDEVITYHNVLELMRDLKKLGANRVDERQAGLRGTKVLKQLQANYQRFRDSNDMLPATYAVHNVVLQKMSQT